MKTTSLGQATGSGRSSTAASAFVSAAVIAASALFFPVHANAQETVRVAGLTWPGYGFWAIVEEKGLAPGLSISYQAIEDPFQSFSLAASGRLDIVSSTIEFAPIGAAEGVPVKLVAYGNLSNGTDSIVLAEGFEDAQALRGESIAVLEGGLSQLFVGMWLEDHGVGIDEVTYVNLIMDRAVAALVGGTVAAAAFWEPFGTQALAALPGARMVANSTDDRWTSLGLIADAHFMSDAFLEERPEVARQALEALYTAIAWWRENPEEGNQIIANALRIPVEDVELVIGSDGTGLDGGLYPYSFIETARFCGVAPGEPPFAQTNGQIEDHWRMINDWWIRFGLMDQTVAPSEGIDCSLLAELHEAGFDPE